MEFHLEYWCLLFSRCSRGLPKGQGFQGLQGQGQETCCRIDLLGFQHLLLRLLLDLLWDLLLRLLMRLLEEMVSHHFFERRKMDGENGKLDGVWSLEMDYSRILGCPQFGKMDLCG